MPSWIRFDHAGQAGFGTLNGEQIAEHSGDLFGQPVPTGRTLALADVRLTLPCLPSKFIGLWNNDHPQAAKNGLAIPPEPLYFIKAASSYCAHEQPIEVPASYDGRVVYEGELGLVIGKTCRNIGVEDAAQAIFGVTCVNDVTALDVLNKDRRSSNGRVPRVTTRSVCSGRSSPPGWTLPTCVCAPWSTAASGRTSPAAA